MYRRGEPTIMTPNRPGTKVPLPSTLSALPAPSSIPASPDSVADAWECTDPSPAHDAYEGTPIVDYRIANHALLVFETDARSDGVDTTYGVVWHHADDWLAGYLCHPRALAAVVGTLTHGILANAYHADLTLDNLAETAADHDGVSAVDHRSQLRSPAAVLDEFSDADTDDVADASLWTTVSATDLEVDLGHEESIGEPAEELIEDQWPTKRDRTFDSESGTWL